LRGPATREKGSQRPSGDLPPDDLPTGPSRYIVSIAERHKGTGDPRVRRDAEDQMAAKKQSQLGAITKDLPQSAAGPSAPLPVAAAAGWDRERARQEYRSRPRPRLGFLPVIIAALVSWLLIVDLSLRAFPWPGKLAIFLAIFAAVRGFLRWIITGRARGPRGFKGGCGRGPRRHRASARRYWDV
jgi:hypothetical protein